MMLALFCGFYVAAGDTPMYADATQVVLMRDGTRTVLSMQNNYKGPPEAFALVIPVPVVLHDGDVKTLPKDVFAKVDRMGAPRLVEYWEQDPCVEPDISSGFSSTGSYGPTGFGAGRGGMRGVTVEAQFAVGEYQIVILSATDSTGLEAWLHDNAYKIPAGAAPLLRPYVENGSKFFVAKVDPKKIKLEDGRAQLSPLRFHYDDEQFALPIRLGLASSSGTQDLIVSILAPNQRYIVANYPNVTIPTNLDVEDAARERFAGFYAALFDRTLAKNPRAIVTEYAWQATTCDPCPGPQLDSKDLVTLGADVLGKHERRRDFVLTRLHARYGQDVKDDLVFVAAPPIAGGREQRYEDGTLEQGARAADVNNFQARYAIRHPWTGAIRCEHPRRGVWGAAPAEVEARADFRPAAIRPATNLAFARRGDVQLGALLAQDVRELDLVRGEVIAAPVAPAAGQVERRRGGCGCDTGGSASLPLGVGTLLALLRRPRRREARSIAA
jgi:hypothetical protein